jgi:dienelactone hydrolase
VGYDPFRRGPFPVGVCTLQLADEAREGRLLPVEIWYPAGDAHAGQDVAVGTRDAYDLIPGFPPLTQDAVRDAAPRAGHWPLIAFSHGYTGHRRQSTFFCTHLASHGYVVVSADHTGNTVLDAVQAMMSGRRPDPAAMLRDSVAARPVDVIFVIDRVLAGAAGGLGGHIDPERIAMTGHSFGGWTTLAVTARDRRIRAALPLAPAGGENPLGANVLGEALDFAWGRDVPTLFLVADQDSLLPLPGMHELHGRTQASKKMVILGDADHLHFCDNVEQVHETFRMMPPDPFFDPVVKNIRPIGELCPGAHAHDLVRGLGLAHMDAVLKGDERAAALLGGDVRALMAGRGVRVEVK